MKFIIVILVLFSSTLSAEVRFTFGGWSKHVISDDIDNESHDVFAAQIRNFEAGRLNNSFGKESYYIAYEHRWLYPKYHVELFTKSGLIRGYDSCFGGKADHNDSTKICPMVAFGLRYTKWFIEPELHVLGDALTLTASVKLGESNG